MILGASSGRLVLGVFSLLCFALHLQTCLSVDPKMCSSLDQFVSNTNRNVTQCERDQNCTIVSCTVSDPTISREILTSKTTFLPCLEPPAISISFLRPNGSVFSSHLVNRTMEVPLLSTPFEVQGFQTTLHISLRFNISHSPDCLQIETDIVQMVAGQTSMIPLNQLTSIMLDPSMCPGGSDSETTPTLMLSTTTRTISVMVTSGTSTLSRSLPLAITIPIFLFLLPLLWIHR